MFLTLVSLTLHSIVAELTIGSPIVSSVSLLRNSHREGVLCRFLSRVSSVLFCAILGFDSTEGTHLSLVAFPYAGALLKLLVNLRH